MPTDISHSGYKITHYDDHDELHFTLDQIIEDCILLADGIEKKAIDLKSEEINIVYIKNGGTFPGEMVSYILRNRGYTVNAYDPHWKRYNEREGGEIRLIEDIIPDQKDTLAKSVNMGNLIIILDDLIDKGDTMSSVRKYYSNLSGMNPHKAKEYIYGAVLHRKDDILETRDTDSLKQFVRFHAKDFPNKDYGKKLWLVYPWEKGSIYYSETLMDMIYTAPSRIIKGIVPGLFKDYNLRNGQNIII